MEPEQCSERETVQCRAGQCREEGVRRVQGKILGGY
jgi:hypothetical protein